MKCVKKTLRFPDGTMQRLLVAYPDSFRSLNFQPLGYEAPALQGFADIYRRYLIPACPWLFGNLVLFRLQEGCEAEVRRVCGSWGEVADPLTAAAHALQKGVKIVFGKPVFLDKGLEPLFARLETSIVRGYLPTTQFIPVGPLPGYLSHSRHTLAVNASFFIMDPFDCATAFDHIGTPIGLQVKDGRVLSPPLFDREALLVRRAGVEVRPVSLEDMEVEAGGIRFRHGVNADFLSRPRRSRAPAGRKKLVIVGDRVEAVTTAAVPIPASGFVLCPHGPLDARPGDKVVYHGFEDVTFGIQVGNSILVQGEKTDSFRSRFYNIRALQPVPYPPSLYPLGFSRDRAARIALGADGEGKPIVLWAEGAPKLGYVPGQHSRGATLADMGDFCAAAGMVNAVNLDGGGSAQLLLSGKRHLDISDRQEADHAQTERAIPLALTVE